MTKEEVRQVVRASGSGDVSEAGAVVLETDGAFSVISKAQLGSRSALADVEQHSPSDPPSPREVVEQHASCRARSELKEDLARQFAPDVVLLSSERVNVGHDSVRTLAQLLHRYLPELDFHVRDLFVDGEYALELWSGRSQNAVAHDGADTFRVRNGRIVAQTIHHSVASTDSDVARPPR